MEGNIQRQRSCSKSVASTIKSGNGKSNATSTRRRGRETTRRQFATYQPDVSEFQPMNATSTRARARLNSRTVLGRSTIPSAASHGMTSPKNRITAPTKRRPGGEKRTSEIVREGIKELREGCLNPMVAHTKEVMPTKEEVRKFTKKGRGGMFNCANQAFDLYRDSCAAGNDWGGDDVFFVNHVGGNGQCGSANPQAPHSPSACRVVSFDRQTKSSSRSRDVNRDAISMEDSIRSRSLRYAEASFVENPVDSFPISDTNEGEALEEDAASILDVDVSVDPQTLRDYRPSLFQNDTGAARAVPRARLGRALQELDHQDETVEELREGVLETRLSLSKTKKLLKEKDTNIKKQHTAITDLKAKFVTEKHSLHERLQREAKENSKLQSKLSTLSSEVSRLHSILRHAKTDLKKTSNRWVEDSRNEEMSKSSGRSSMMPAEDTAVVSALRFEIVDLKNQLEEAQMFKKLTVVTPEYDSADVERLKKHLERAEIELRRLKEVRLTKPLADQRMIDELRTALAKSEKALRLAVEKNKSLSLELQDTKIIIATLEKTHRERHTQSIAEVEVLKLRLGKLENGTQARQQADNELAECGREAEELQKEMQRMAEALAEETRRARLEGSERVNERMQYEYKLEEKSEQGRRFREQINKLEQSLAKAEEDAAIRKGATNDIGQEVVNETNQLNQRSVKRRLDTPNQLHGPATDRSLLAFQPLSSPAQPALDVIERNKHAEEEARLKAEVAELSKKLRLTEEIALKAKDDAIYATQEARVEAAEKERELNELKARLAKESQLSGETQKERDFNEAEFAKLKESELNLDNDMRKLQARLDSAESKVQQEMFRAEEERRMAVETDTERVAEIHRLKDKLERAKSEKYPHTTVEKLASRIDFAEKEFENYRTHSDSGFDVEGHDPDRAMRNARALVREHGMTLGYSYEDGASFISSSESSSSSSSVSSLNASRSTMVISNMVGPVESLSTRSVGSVTSLQNMSTASSFRKGAPSLDKNGRTERFVSPSGSFDTSPGRSRSPLSPPRIKTMSTPLTKGTLLSFLVEEISPKTKFGRANKSPGRRTIGVPSKESLVRRLDINNMQRRLLKCNDRLSAAKYKSKGLVTVSDENKAEQTRIKTSVDDIFDTVSMQTQMALVRNASFDSSRSCDCDC